MFGSGRRKEEIQVTYPSSFFPRNKKGCWRICACVLFFFLFLPCLLVSSNLWHACGRSLVLKRITFCQACLSLAVIPWETKQTDDHSPITSNSHDKDVWRMDSWSLAIRQSLSRVRSEWLVVCYLLLLQALFHCKFIFLRKIAMKGVPVR